MFGKERVYRSMPEDSDNSVIGLSDRARNHLARTCGDIGGKSLVVEVINAHGEDAQQLIETLKLEDKPGFVLDVGERYIVLNPHPSHPAGMDAFTSRTHRHDNPSDIV